MSLPKPLLTTAPKDDLTNQLLTRFKELIARGVLGPGARLPAERDLAKRFAVSRSSLRHALKVLEIMGVLTQRVGDGTYLAKSAARILSEPLEFLVLLDGISSFDLLETRAIVEPELAARAAERAGAEDLAALERSLAGMRGQTDLAALVELDGDFHRAIFRASGNVLCNRIFTLIHQAMVTSITLTSQLVEWEHTIAFHRPIYQAVERRDPAEARRRMTAHLADARELLARASHEAVRLCLPAEIRPIVRTGRGKKVPAAPLP